MSRSRGGYDHSVAPAELLEHLRGCADERAVEMLALATREAVAEAGVLLGVAVELDGVEDDLFLLHGLGVSEGGVVESGDHREAVLLEAMVEKPSARFVRMNNCDVRKREGAPGAFGQDHNTGN